MKNIYKKPKNMQIWNFYVALFQVSNPDSVEVNIDTKIRILQLSKHGPSYLGTLRGKDLEMAKQLSEHTRLVDKKGRNQVSFKDMEEQSAMYMKDIFTTFVDAHWYYVLIAFFASFFGKYF